MRVGIGLPVTTRGTSGELLLDWARRAEQAGFDVLTSIDRIVYPGFESLTAMAAAAAATSGIGLRTNVLLAPARSAPMVAKQAASVDQISGGRFMLGIGVGRRTDDYEATGRAFGTRGRRLDADLGTMHAEWRGQPGGGRDRPSTLAPVRDSAVPVFFGGSLEAAIPRIVRWGVGWSVSSRGPAEAHEMAEKVRAAWREAGRDGAPAIMVMHYFALGDDPNVDYLFDYYGYQGDRARMFAEGAYRRAADVTAAVRDFASIGVDEYVFVPTMADLSQVDLLADAALG
ncbi:MAG: LLM class flavin-dependent oxidoreductase [Acidimicrobiaceae bacterium]|nr:LLM class flavin-dependent oxidoreductase [Acidimicrobiaceae bacterium]